MKIRFQADNDLRSAIIEATLRQNSSIDFQTARRADLDGLDDPGVLELAAEEDRILVSHDFNTMPRHLMDFARSSHSPGVLLIPQNLPIRKAVDSLILVWDHSEPTLWENRVCLIPSLATLVYAGPI